MDSFQKGIASLKIQLISLLGKNIRKRLKLLSIQTLIDYSEPYYLIHT